MDAAFFNVRVQKAAVFVQEAILKGRINVKDPFVLIKEIFAIISTVGVSDMNDHKQVAFKTIERIAAGADGISGTDDDLIPVEVVQKIGALLQGDMIGNVIDFVASSSLITTAVDIAPTCFAPLLSCLKSLSSKPKTVVPL